ncbi:MAG: FHA domain-containing protein [Ignavibacteriaceae bacterium]|nr:FHA domain-containing protein [Ignavibacteriaceae bacterium]
MNCPSCGKANKPAAKFCKFCGSPLSANYKTCANGHNFDATLADCPYCPKPVANNVVQDNITSAKTVLDNPDVEVGKTTLDTKTEKPTTTRSEVEKDKITETNKSPVTITSEKKLDEKAKKLIGWLVTFDLNPEGTDFKLYDGRLKIGRDQSNDIVLDDPDVSDEHVLIFCKDNQILLQDELSANGTFVNGKKIDSRIGLKDNDEIKAGKTSFKVKII